MSTPNCLVVRIEKVECGGFLNFGPYEVPLGLLDNAEHQVTIPIESHSYNPRELVLIIRPRRKQ